MSNEIKITQTSDSTAVLADMQKTQLAIAKTVVLSRGPWPQAKLADALEIMFDDGTDSPYALHLSPESFLTLPSADDVGRTDLVCLVYTRPGADGLPRLAGTRQAAYRLAPRIPWLKPWA